MKEDKGKNEDKERKQDKRRKIQAPNIKKIFDSIKRPTDRGKGKKQIKGIESNSNKA